MLYYEYKPDLVRQQVKLNHDRIIKLYNVDAHIARRQKLGSSYVAFYTCTTIFRYGIGN